MPRQRKRREEFSSPISLDESSWQQYLQKRKVREQHAVPVPQFVRVEGTNPEAARHLEEFLQPLAGKPIDNARVNRLLTRLTGIGKYDSADYRMANRNGQDGLVVTVQEKNYAPPILQLGFGVDGSENDDVTFTLTVAPDLDGCGRISIRMANGRRAWKHV